jgi:hypothetical protein
LQQQQLVRQLEQELTQKGSDYLIDQREDDACLLRFIGHFDGKPVVWHTELQTLRKFADDYRKRTATNDLLRLRQFIDMDKQQEHYRLQIGLNLDKIDDAAILRTIIMVRQYKRLHMGRHEYGECIEL